MRSLPLSAPLAKASCLFPARLYFNPARPAFISACLSLAPSSTTAAILLSGFAAKRFVSVSNLQPRSSDDQRPGPVHLGSSLKSPARPRKPPPAESIQPSTKSKKSKSKKSKAAQPTVEKPKAKNTKAEQSKSTKPEAKNPAAEPSEAEQPKPKSKPKFKDYSRAKGKAKTEKKEKKKAKAKPTTIAPDESTVAKSTVTKSTTKIAIVKTPPSKLTTAKSTITKTTTVKAVVVKSSLTKISAVKTAASKNRYPEAVKQASKRSGRHKWEKWPVPNTKKNLLVTWNTSYYPIGVSNTGHLIPPTGKYRLTPALFPMEKFVPVRTLSRWPYEQNRFTKAELQIISPLWVETFNRPWDVYHLETWTNHWFLVPIEQVQEYFKYIFEQTGIRKNLLAVPTKSICFRAPENAKEKKPQLVGKSNSREEYDKIIDINNWKEEDMPPERLRYHKKNDIRKAKRQEARKLEKIDWVGQIRTARQVLNFGMHSTAKHEDPDAVGGGELGAQKPVLVSIDVEAWERDQNRITEIGISVLDTAKIPPPDQLPKLSVADLPSNIYTREEKPPRTRACAVVELITARHLRVDEHRYLRNGKFVPDAADNFEFGQSEWVTLKNVPRAIGEALRFMDQDGNKRKIIIVGHSVKNDLNYLRTTGYDVFNIKDLGIMDTCKMYAASIGSNQQSGLHKVLNELGVTPWNLHNAGNDAYYTLEAFVRLADRGIVSKAHTKDTTESSKDSVEVISESTTLVMVETPALPPDADYEDLVEAGLIKVDHATGKTTKTGLTKREKEERKRVNAQLQVEVEELTSKWASATIEEKQNSGW